MQFPFSEAMPVQFPGPLPAASDVVVVGGGIIGVMTALFLRRRGVSVTVLEKGRIAAEQSSRNWGWVRQQGRDPDELPIMMEARRLWLELARECGEEVGLEQRGVTFLARDEAQVERYAPFLRLAAEVGLDTRLLSRKETADLLPDAAQGFAGAITTPSDMRAEPWLAVPAFARLAAREGVVIRENCAARKLDISAGRVGGIWTEAGFISCSTVLVAGGAWSSLFLRAHGVSIPQLNVRGTVAATEPMPEVHGGAASDGKIAFRRRTDGGFTLAAGGRKQVYVGPDAFRHFTKYIPVLRKDPFGTGLRPLSPAGYPDHWRTPRRWEGDAPSPFERLRILSPGAEPGALDEMKRRFGKLFPGAGEVRIRTAWAGMMDAMPDFVPVVDHAPSIPGLVIGTGMSAHGFGIGPGFGRVLADLILGNDPGHDLSRFRFSRFSDGSAIRPGPAL